MNFYASRAAAPADLATHRPVTSGYKVDIWRAHRPSLVRMVLSSRRRALFVVVRATCRRARAGGSGSGPNR
jgi:hypothetical protein